MLTHSWVELKKLAKENSENNPWWYSQPEYLAEKIKEQGIEPKNILDVGCGDGRFYKGFKQVFPESKFYGIDVFEFQIQVAKEAFPDGIWDTGYFQVKTYDVPFDLLICAGLFNPVSFEYWPKQIKVAMSICAKIRQMASEYLLITVDFNIHKIFIHEYLRDMYKITKEWQVPDHLKNENQILAAFLYERIK